MLEDTPTCQIHKKYSEIDCTDLALDGDPDGYCILHSQNLDKDPEAFREALLIRWAKEDTEFYDFRCVFFPGPFDPAMVFGGREFEEPVDFSMATFKEDAVFFRASFKDWAYFSKATFMEEADFRGATFKKGADFYSATFTKNTFFFRTTFVKEADFSRAIILGRVIFRKINTQDEAGQAPQFMGKFNNLELLENKLLRFHDLSLAHCGFEGNDLRRVEFHHVKWHHYPGRRAIYDEVFLREFEKVNPWFWNWLLRYAPFRDPPTSWTDYYGEVERLYRNLKLNYEDSGDFKNSGDFHYGEMEMHRRASKWRWFPLYWYNLYWALSGYGERPSRALSWLAAFLAVFTGLLAWAGLEILDPKHSAGFGNSFFYLLQKVTLQRPTWAEPMGFWGKLVAGFSVLLLPGQAALFILALRNRLGRRR